MPMKWTAYVDHLIGQRLGERTIARYVRWLRDADEWLRRQGTTLDAASASQIRDWSTARVAFSHSSRAQASAALTHYWRMTDRSDAPSKAIIVPPSPEMSCRAITETQARDVVKVALGWWPEGTVVLCGMYLALRRFEIAKMEWSRFSTDLTWYTVTGKYSRTAELPVNPVLVAELAPRRGEGWVFPGRYPGHHIHEATVWDWTRRVGQAAGIPHLEPHELRHTSIARVNDVLGDLRAAQTFARHVKPSVTAGYTRTKRSRLREASDALDYLDPDAVSVCAGCGAGVEESEIKYARCMAEPDTSA